MLEDSVPQNDETARRQYVSRVAGFYGGVFKEKLKHFIGMQLEELAMIGRSEVGIDILRSNINCFRLMNTWMLKMTNEHIGNGQEQRSALPTNAEFINKMKKKYD